jgi:hypothetical protein
MQITDLYNLIIYQQLWGTKFKENYMLGMRTKKKKRLNTTALKSDRQARQAAASLTVWH